MKVFDKTPFADRQGNINIISRIQGTLKYGLNWYNELEAQKSVVAQLDRLLDKGFVLIRNFTLPGSDIVIPLILIGPGSFSVIFVTPLRGHFEAKGTEWNTVNNGVSVPAGRNLIDLLSKLARAFQRYLQINNINIPMQVEPVLIASDPGSNVESVRPAVRVVRSDAIKQFANTLNQSSPVLRVEQVLVSADLIIEPQPKSTEKPPEPEMPVERPVSRAQAIFNASESAEPAAKPAPGIQQRPTPASQAQPVKKAPAISRNQILLLAVLGLAECCILFGGIYLLFFLN
ncbi:MAG: hypothetical protein HYU84_13380 [Chloroflexi bacterium]|nr:hypothetical protein [Chloroflexota bacterium]MBI3167190.1 hypothetical protein [Chloroflexota bacterium]